MKLELLQKDLIRLLIRRIRENGTTSSGTYNKADPTHYERGKCSFYAGDSITGQCEETGYEEYEPNLLEVSFYDCTWGIEIECKLCLPNGVTEASSGYLDSDDGTWSRVEGEFFRDLRNALLCKTWAQMIEQEQECQMDPAGGYGLESHR